MGNNEEESQESLPTPVDAYLSQLADSLEDADVLNAAYEPYVEFYLYGLYQQFKRRKKTDREFINYVHKKYGTPEEISKRILPLKSPPPLRFINPFLIWLMSMTLIIFFTIVVTNMVNVDSSNFLLLISPIMVIVLSVFFCPLQTLARISFNKNMFTVQRSPLHRARTFSLEEITGLEPDRSTLWGVPPTKLQLEDGTIVRLPRSDNYVLMMQVVRTYLAKKGRYISFKRRHEHYVNNAMLKAILIPKLSKNQLAPFVVVAFLSLLAAGYLVLSALFSFYCLFQFILFPLLMLFPVICLFARTRGELHNLRNYFLLMSLIVIYCIINLSTHLLEIVGVWQFGVPLYAVRFVMIGSVLFLVAVPRFAVAGTFRYSLLAYFVVLLWGFIFMMGHQNRTVPIGYLPEGIPHSVYRKDHLLLILTGGKPNDQTGEVINYHLVCYHLQIRHRRLFEFKSRPIFCALPERDKILALEPVESSVADTLAPFNRYLSRRKKHKNPTSILWILDLPSEKKEKIGTIEGDLIGTNKEMLLSPDKTKVMWNYIDRETDTPVAAFFDIDFGTLLTKPISQVGAKWYDEHSIIYPMRETLDVAHALQKEYLVVLHLDSNTSKTLFAIPQTNGVRSAPDDHPYFYWLSPHKKVNVYNFKSGKHREFEKTESLSWVFWAKERDAFISYLPGIIDSEFGEEGILKVYDLQSGTCTTPIKTNQRILTATLSPDAEVLTYTVIPRNLPFFLFMRRKMVNIATGKNLFLPDYAFRGYLNSLVIDGDPWIDDTHIAISWRKGGQDRASVVASYRLRED